MMTISEKNLRSELDVLFLELQPKTTNRKVFTEKVLVVMREYLNDNDLNFDLIYKALVFSDKTSISFMKSLLWRLSEKQRQEEAVVLARSIKDIFPEIFTKANLH